MNSVEVVRLSTNHVHVARQLAAELLAVPSVSSESLAELLDCCPLPFHLAITSFGSLRKPQVHNASNSTIVTVLEPDVHSFRLTGLLEYA